MNTTLLRPAIPSPAIQNGQDKVSDRESTLLPFIFKRKVNTRILSIAAIASLLQLLVFKTLYPYPDFIGDSYSYIDTNQYHMPVNLWPVGYSWFLKIIHQINHSDTFLVATQYMTLQASLIYSYFTLTYLYDLKKTARTLLFIFLILNPISLYLSNCVLSDSLFATLSIVFIMQFLWMFHKPNYRQLAIQGLIIGLAFTLRYTAIYYPVVAVIGFILAKQSLKYKLLGISLGLLMMIPFYLYTSNETRKITGYSQFSVFGGWQLANNALYMYNHIQVDSAKLLPNTVALDRLSKQYFKVAPLTQKILQDFPGTYFIKAPNAILKPYMAPFYKSEAPLDNFKSWGKVSPIYQAYGAYLITHYPLSFARYYLWLNTKNYFFPHLEKFDLYNMGQTYVPASVQDWFKYTTPNVQAVSFSMQGNIFRLYPLIFFSLNVYYLVSIIWLLRSGIWKNWSPTRKQIQLFVFAYLLVNFGFSIFATPVVLRYQVVPLIILFSFCLINLKMIFEKSPETQGISTK